MGDYKAILELQEEIRESTRRFFNQKAVMSYLFGRPHLSCLPPGKKSASGYTSPFIKVTERYTERQPLLVDRTHADQANGALIRVSHQSFLYRDQYIRSPGMRVRDGVDDINSSDQIMRIATILDELGADYALNVNFRAEDLTASETGYRLSSGVKVDFLGMLTIQMSDPMVRQVVFFAIIYDRTGRGFRLIDHLSQAHLRQMGVHLLRLTYGLNYHRLIEGFIDKLLKTDYYLAINPLHPLRTERERDSLLIREEFERFAEEYRRNHLLTLSHTLLTEQVELELDEEPPGYLVPASYVHPAIDIRPKGSSKRVPDSFLAEFLSTYRPAKLDLSCYLEFEELQGYQMIKGKKDHHLLIPGRTHLKLVGVQEAIVDGMCRSKSIEDGGILLDAGKLVKGKIINRDLDPKDWTHLQLETSISKKTGAVGRFYRYIIRLRKYHLFYRHYAHDNDKPSNYLIELV